LSVPINRDKILPNVNKMKNLIIKTKIK
jgi:hypothetical protein